MESEDKNKGKDEEKKLQKIVGKRFRRLREAENRQCQFPKLQSARRL